MEFSIKRKNINPLWIVVLTISFILMFMSIKGIIDGKDMKMAIINLVIIVPIIAFPAIMNILSFKKLSRIVVEGNEEFLQYTNMKTNKVNKVFWKDILSIVNIERTKNTRGCFAIIVNKEVDDVGKKIYFNPQENKFKFDDLKYNAIFIELNTINSEIDDSKIQEILKEYVEKSKLKNN